MCVREADDSCTAYHFDIKISKIYVTLYFATAIQSLHFQAMKIFYLCNIYFVLHTCRYVLDFAMIKFLTNVLVRSMKGKTHMLYTYNYYILF